MKVALINPPWSFAGSIYFGCTEPHLPLEYGYAKALLQARGHTAHIIDAQLEGLPLSSVRSRIEDIRPEMTVVTTAPSYLFWRCPPPEVRVPRSTFDAVRDVAGTLVCVGPHGSVTPESTRRKLGVDVVVLGECEEVLLELAETPRERWTELDSIVLSGGSSRPAPKPRAARLDRLPELAWEPAILAKHTHHHHRFDRHPDGPGAELEASRGCPYHCTFCAKERFRDGYRRRPLGTVLGELDALIAQGVGYVYFIDEIFLPDRALLEALGARDVRFGVQLRIDNWSREMLDLLGRAGCVSIEAGVESLTEQGRSLLAKNCRLSTSELTELLVWAKNAIPFVQANLLFTAGDDARKVEAWREDLKERGVWANDPVPLFPYPGSPEYTQKWGPPDDRAWERAHEHYLSQFEQMSEVQQHHPLPLSELEPPPFGHAPS
jgi:anaerobic magnesium-protoporphyrin IX monomethyl ester cyclase